MAEWLKAAVLKTVECQSSVGSNPTPSARKFIFNEFYRLPLACCGWLKALHYVMIL